MLEVANRITAISRLREVIAYASLDDDFFALLTDAGDREIIRQTLIYVYLLDFKGKIEGLIVERQQITEYGQLLISGVEHPFSPQKPTTPTSAEDSIRTAGFRQTIMGCTITHVLSADCVSLQWMEKARLMPRISSHFVFQRMTMSGMESLSANCTIGVLIKD